MDKGEITRNPFLRDKIRKEMESIIGEFDVKRFVDKLEVLLDMLKEGGEL